MRHRPLDLIRVMPAEGKDVNATQCTVVVVAGGDPVDLAVLDRLPAHDAVVAADSGVDHALALGLHVDVAVGDFDSASPEALAAAEASGTVVDRHPAAKDEIDLELALDRAVAMGAGRVVVVGGHGGRIDLFLANALLLAAPRYAGVTLEAHMGPARVFVGRDELMVSGQPGELLTLLPVHGPAEGVTTEGLRYPLRGEPLPSGTSRGCSNELLGTSARITLTAGVLLAVLPGSFAIRTTVDNGGVP